MVSLYVASHYKNTPNDLLLMADAPAHHLFALLAPVDEKQVSRVFHQLVLISCLVHSCGTLLCLRWLLAYS